MRALRFAGINLLWFLAWLTTYVFIGKASFDWQRWYVFPILVANIVGAVFLAHLHIRMKPPRGDISLSTAGCAIALVLNAVFAFVVYAIVLFLMYGE